MKHKLTYTNNETIPVKLWGDSGEGTVTGEQMIVDGVPSGIFFYATSMLNPRSSEWRVTVVNGVSLGTPPRNANDKKITGKKRARLWGYAVWCEFQRINAGATLTLDYVEWFSLQTYTEFDLNRVVAMYNELAGGQR